MTDQAEGSTRRQMLLASGAALAAHLLGRVGAATLDQPALAAPAVVEPAGQTVNLFAQAQEMAARGLAVLNPRGNTFHYKRSNMPLSEVIEVFKEDLPSLLDSVASFRNIRDAVICGSTEQQAEIRIILQKVTEEKKALYLANLKHLASLLPESDAESIALAAYFNDIKNIPVADREARQKTLTPEQKLGRDRAAFARDLHEVLEEATNISHPRHPPYETLNLLQYRAGLSTAINKARELEMLSSEVTDTFLSTVDKKMRDIEDGYATDRLNLTADGIRTVTEIRPYFVNSWQIYGNVFLDAELVRIDFSLLDFSINPNGAKEELFQFDDKKLFRRIAELIDSEIYNALSCYLDRDIVLTREYIELTAQKVNEIVSDIYVSTFREKFPYVILQPNFIPDFNLSKDREKHIENLLNKYNKAKPQQVVSLHPPVNSALNAANTLMRTAGIPEITPVPVVDLPEPAFPIEMLPPALPAPQPEITLGDLLPRETHPDAQFSQQGPALS